MNSNEKLEREKQRRIKEKNRRIRERQRRKRVAKRFFIITVILYVFLLLAVLVAISLSLKSCKSSEPKTNIEISDKDNNTETINKSELYYDDVLYIPLTAIEKLTDIKVTGDKDNISFILEVNGEFAKFEINSTKAQVNSNGIELSSKSLIKDGILYLPFDFFTDYMQGFIVELDEKQKVKKISLDPNVEPQFVLKAPTQTDPVKEKDATEITDAPIDFVLDLSLYEEYMNPTDRDAYLFIVSADQPLTRDYVPTELTGSIYTRSDRDTRQLSKYACLALEAFLKEGEANGIYGVTVTSAYRSYEYQEELFQQEIQVEGSYEEAAKDVNPPGISEHQTGLAVDMHNMPSASQAFGDTKEAKWLAENAHKFGYILRYPKGKTDKTGINYEPWHFRYVGRYHATKMYELDMCLEEYMEYIKQ